MWALDSLSFFRLQCIYQLPHGIDGLITQDSDSGLEWLDVTATLGKSFEEAEATAFVIKLGFRHATVAEVRSLFEVAGIKTFNGKYAVENLDGATLVLRLLGRTADETTAGNPKGISGQMGWSDSGNPHSNTAPLSMIILDLQSISDGEASVVEVGSYGNKDSRDINVGNWLVRRSMSGKR